jgi:hypothetical protein
MHLDMSQRLQVDPCSLSVIRYTPLRPFLLRMNDTGGAVGSRVGGRPDDRRATAAATGAPEGGPRRDSDAVIGGGAGG